ncbi:MAG: transposase [Hyphomicrobiaceae bacterium]|nr:transposase [Hyphomicrobiaceae bacterium]
MKEWLTAREIAEERLTELPANATAMIRFAARAGWDDCLSLSRPRKGRGGGLEYHISLLPPLARLEYERRHRKIEAVAVPARPQMQLGTDLSERAARERDARLAVVTAYDAFRRGQRLGEASCVQIFVDRYNMGTHPVENWIKDLIPRLSKRSLARWKAATEIGRADRLAVDRSAARKGKGVIETANGGAVRTFILALVAHQPLLSAAQVRTLCRSEFGDTLSKADGTNIDMPPLRTFQQALQQLKATEKVALTKLSDPDRYRSTMAPAGVGTYRWISTPNALWMIDASPVDALCTDGRHHVYACIDIATRRTILYISQTPRAEAVGLLLRRAILGWGVPDKIKTDNGSDFVARSTARLMASLGIEAEKSDAYSPQQKGHVERVIKTFQHDFAALLPGFVGHSVADRKRIEDRKGFAARLGQDTADAFGVSLTGAKLQDLADRWARDVYEQREHSALKGLSPALAAAQSTSAIRTVDERALDILLMPVPGSDGIRTVTKFGIRVDHHHYVIHEADVGQRVLVRMDPADCGRVIAFDAETGTYVGEGICPELRGIDAATVLKAKREITAERIADATADARRAIKDLTKGPALIERVLAVAARDVPNVVALPKRTERHSTPALEAAAAGAHRRQPDVKPLTARAAELHAELASAQPVVMGHRDKVRPLRTQETRQQRFRRALELQARHEAGGELATEEAFWLGGYVAGSEYRAMRAVYEDGGEQILG